MNAHGHTLTIDPNTGDIKLASAIGIAASKLDAAITRIEGIREGLPRAMARRIDAKKALTAIRAEIRELQAKVTARISRETAAVAAGTVLGAEVDVIAGFQAHASSIMAMFAAYGTEFEVGDIDTDLPKLMPDFEVQAEREQLAQEVGTERVDSMAVVWQSLVATSGFKDGEGDAAIEIWRAWEIPNVPAVAAPALALLKPVAVTKEFNTRRQVQDELSGGETKQPFQLAAGNVAAAQAKAHGLATARTPEAKGEIEAQTMYVPDDRYGKVETPKSKATVSNRLKLAVGGNVVAFLKGLGSPAKIYNGYTHDDFVTDWADQTNKDWIKNQFRAVVDGTHEWITCSLIDKVLERAHSAADAEKAEAWIELQNRLRTDTSHLILKPGCAFGNATKTIGGRTFRVLTGHVGALYVKTDTAVVALTENTNLWHDALRTAFGSATTVSGCVAALKAKFDETVWKGTSEPLPDDIYKEYLDSGGEKIDFSTLAATQKTNYDAAEAVFNKCLEDFAGF